MRFAILAAGLALALAAGCGKPQATVRHMTGGPDETLDYDLAVFQLAKGEKVQIILFHRVAAPVGEADPDFEYTLFELPEREHYGWVRDDNVHVYRWVRHGSRDYLWRGTSGQAGLVPGDAKRHMHFDFQVTMEPMQGTQGGSYVLSGRIKVMEDMVVAQGLENRYGDWLLSLLGMKPKEPAGTKAKSLLSPPKKAAGKAK
jgi:hypothetical protein